MASTFDSNNPQAIRSVITPSVEKLVRSRLGEDAQSAQLAEYGLDLVECQLGASCGEKSDRALDLCAKNGWCADSVPNALRIGLGDNYSKLASVSSEVVQHLSARHFRFFVPDA